jgi:histidinol-phosphate aminotransferase
MGRRDIAPLSRRSFLQGSTIASAALAFRVVTEPMLAFSAAADHQPDHPEEAIYINANENPLGPCAAAREAVAAVIPRGGRYLFPAANQFQKEFAQSLGLTEEQVDIYPGSSNPLQYAVCAFCSPRASYVTGDPGYEAGMHAADDVGARVVKVPLAKTYAHDVKAMLAAAPDAGVFYVCTPNNPTGTLTGNSDIEYLVAHKPKNAIVLVDEAYIHFSDAPSAIELVKAGKDVVVLRTFSKLYGMAGLRCGAAVARPDLLKKLREYGGYNAMPVTGVVAASASLKQPQLIAERKRVNEQVRRVTFEWFDANGYSYTPSVSNCFLLDTRRPAKEVIAAMAAQNVVIGRVWPSMPTHARITVGTSEEMAKFREAFQKVMKGSVSG